MPNQFLSPEGDLENYFVTESWLIDQYVGDALWTWGSNGQEQLGNNTSTNRSTPVTTFAGGTNWKQVAGGGLHTAAIKTDGTLWVWGYNAYNFGQLGTNDATQRPTPVTTFAGGTNWKQVACGQNHTAAIKTDGTLWVWGQNYGQLGINAGGKRNTPVTTFAGGTNWKQVAGGGYNTAAIKTDGTLWTWGTNGSGQLGTNDADSRGTPVTTFAGGTNWKQVTCGSQFTAAIKTDGTLWTWGSGSSGQLGTISQYITNGTVSVGSSIFYTSNTVGITTGLLAIGGLSSLGTVVSVNSGVSITFSGTYTSGIVLTGEKDGPYRMYVTSGDIGSISSGDTVISYSTDYGSEPEWTTVDFVDFSDIYFTPDSYTGGWGGTITIASAGGGGPFSGNLYLQNDILRNISTPVTTFAGGTNWKQVACGQYHTAAIKTDGTLWTWGDNSSVQLGDNTTVNKLAPVTTFAGGINWKQVACGGAYIAAIKTDGTLWTWGLNTSGQLGNASTTNRSTPVTTFAGGTNWKQVSGGGSHTTATTSGTDPTYFIS